MNKRIAFDLHGVLDTKPELYGPMIKVLKSAGHEIFILSGPKRIDVLEQLKKLPLYIGPPFEILSVVDFLEDNGVEFNWDGNHPWTDDETWWDSKARICKEKGIDILIDDSIRYKPAFDLIDTKFIHTSELEVCN